MEATTSTAGAGNYKNSNGNGVTSGGNAQRHKSWSELKAVVNEIRTNLSGLSNGISPMNVKFRTLSDGRVRIYFLSTPPRGYTDTTLLWCDVLGPAQDNCSLNSIGGHEAEELTVNALLEPTNSLSTNSFSREMQLLLERKRLSIWGITSYEMHLTSGKIIFPACNSLYQCLDTGFNTTPLFPTELRICPQFTPIDSQICPKNSDLVAYVCGGDIWVSHTQSGHGQRLTHAHDGRKSFAEDPLSAGLPSYVMQEEFNRYVGFWWQPQSDDDIFRIVYEEVDESDVGVYTFPSLQSVGTECEIFRYPRAGSPNAKSKLKLVQFRLSEILQIAEVEVKDLISPVNYNFAWCEYVVRIGWTPNGNYVWSQLLDRVQQKLVLLLIPLDNFCEPGESPSSSDHEENSNSSWKSPNDKPSSPLQVIYTETSSVWINVHDIIDFVEITDTSCTFIWASEETGYRHLYLVTSSLLVNESPQINGEMSSSGVEAMQTEDINLTSRIINKVTLTRGEWEVLGKEVKVDHKHGLVYFIGFKETPLEKHLYVVSYKKVDYIRILTTRGFSHSIDMNEDCTLYLQGSCNLTSLPKWEVIKISHDDSSVVGGVDGVRLTVVGTIGTSSNSTPSCNGELPVHKKTYSPQIYTPKLSSGDIVYAMVFKPHNFKLGVKYPTILNVYGGPGVQVVSNTYKGMRNLRSHMLASQGYCVVCIDTRGSRHRGLKFEAHLQHRMGTVEMADQVEVLRTLSDALGYIDLDRVGIHGWSYGGYLSLMGLVQYPEVFKVSVAGAPVTDWELYDSGYTERYMNLPENNHFGYLAGSVMYYIHKFPDEDNRLLILHGLQDENVHFFHTSQLINALTKANKPYKLQIYPNERHSIRNVDASKHYETAMLSFLQSNL